MEPASRNPPMLVTMPSAIANIRFTPREDAIAAPAAGASARAVTIAKEPVQNRSQTSTGLTPISGTSYNRFAQNLPPFDPRLLHRLETSFADLLSKTAISRCDARFFI